MVVTMLEAVVPADQTAVLEEEFRRSTANLPPIITETFLLHHEGGDTWRIVTVWERAEDLQAYRASVETPDGVRMFRAVGTEPTLGVFEGAAHASHA